MREPCAYPAEGIAGLSQTVVDFIIDVGRKPRNPRGRMPKEDIGKNEASVANTHACPSQLEQDMCASKPASFLFACSRTP